MENEPLFRSAHDALTFAYNYSGQQYERSLMAKVASPGTGSGKGLSGNDGAAQAGMIRREVQQLGRLPEAILMARFAPRSIICECRAPCCKRSRDNDEWVNAISHLADYMRNTALAGTTANGLVRRDCVIRHFTSKEKRKSLEAFADDRGINRDTASAYASKVATWFIGSPARNDKPSVPGHDALAMAAIETKLLSIGMISG